jgi:hypothetical protein
MKISLASSENGNSIHPWRIIIYIIKIILKVPELAPTSLTKM